MSTWGEVGVGDVLEWEAEPDARRVFLVLGKGAPGPLEQSWDASTVYTLLNLFTAERIVWVSYWASTTSLGYSNVVKLA